ncbi:TonB-dependent receptor [Niveibacterium umoris]|uniref:Iron complex outermembrane receptor protein n=1 Tax=Niveibacterium umoris TaxID=1193620 RepID=A0A840BH04_9RHOO|nr:TonB-dependent receptor [Niveibacterium umoris]MBB4010948.1 iron complex outermembrane receptor protein [Niveibacterium umoris]
MTQAQQRMPKRRAAPFRLTPCAQAVALAVSLGAVSAHAEEVAKVDKIQVTGSSIKRIEGETALPVQMIKKEDIIKSGATTAAELMKIISANNAPLTDGASITDNTGGQRGFNGANLRGIGVSSTLVLLNGRRMANFASPGDSAGVDLNNIPAGAIERVDVLKDGASAIYGTDAIGGVINFITRKDYIGADVNVYASATEEGGAGKTAASIGGGYGNLNTDRFNVFGVFDAQKLDSLRSTQREFLKERPLATNLPFYMSSRTDPANIRLSKAQRADLQAAGYLIGGEPITERTINPFSPKCNPPATVYAANQVSQGCSYDYMQDTEIYPESEKLGFLGRGVYRMGERTDISLEVMKNQTTTTYVASPNPLAVTGVPVSVVNGWLGSRALPTTGNVELRQRVTEGGNRSNEVVSDAQRIVFAINGGVGNWDYDVGLNYASNETSDRMVDGYFLYNEFVAGIKAGQINPFGASPAAGKSLINSLKVNEVSRESKGETTSIDGKISGALMALEGGDLNLAAGFEFRREKAEFTPSALLNSNNIAGDRSSSGATLEATSNSRNISSVFAELSAPFTKQVEAQFALRYDNYSDVGSTVNPKLGLRWQPSKSLLVRGSAGTGFRAPTFSELYRPTSFGSSSAILPDPGCVAAGNVLVDCTDQVPVERRANPDLKPEKSRQFSAGFVFEPARNATVSVDYWNIKKKDIISGLAEEIILENLDKYEAKYVTRDSDGFIANMILQKQNQGELRTSGLDFEGSWRSSATAYGRFGMNFSGTWVLEYKRQFGSEEFVDNVGKFLVDQVVQKWRHRLSFDWELAQFGLTLANSYSSGYTDHNKAVDPNAAGGDGALLPPRDVSEYSTWDLVGTWIPSKSFKLRAGIINLFNTAPPFSNQSYYFLSTYDPTYTDPRGRTYYASASYSFK